MKEFRVTLSASNGNSIWSPEVLRVTIDVKAESNKEARESIRECLKGVTMGVRIVSIDEIVPYVEN